MSFCILKKAYNLSCLLFVIDIYIVYNNKKEISTGNLYIS